MSLTKVDYSDYQTVIGAANLNAIQDEIILRCNTVEQKTFSDAQKTQARANIGAASTNDVTAAAGDIIVTVSLAANSSNQSFTPTHDANIAKLTTNHIVEPNSYILSNPAAMTAGWSVNTDNAPTSITITGTPAAATNLTLYFRLKQ